MFTMFWVASMGSRDRLTWSTVSAATFRQFSDAHCKMLINRGFSLHRAPPFFACETSKRADCLRAVKLSSTSPLTAHPSHENWVREHQQNFRPPPHDAMSANVASQPATTHAKCSGCFCFLAWHTQRRGISPGLRLSASEALNSTRGSVSGIP